MAGTDFATQADLVAFVPDLLTKVDGATVDRWLGVSAALFDAACWGDCLCNGHAFLTLAWLLELPDGTAPNSGSGAGYGNITAKADHGASISYGATGSSWTDPDDAALATTFWGRRYLDLREKLRPPFVVALARGRSRWPR